MLLSPDIQWKSVGKFMLKARVKLRHFSLQTQNCEFHELSLTFLISLLSVIFDAIWYVLFTRTINDG